MYLDQFTDRWIVAESWTLLNGVLVSRDGLGKYYRNRFSLHFSQKKPVSATFAATIRRGKNAIVEWRSCLSGWLRQTLTKVQRKPVCAMSAETIPRDKNAIVLWSSCLSGWLRQTLTKVQRKPVSAMYVETIPRDKNSLEQCPSNRRRLLSQNSVELQQVFGSRLRREYNYSFQ
jgi:hypothetical protein